MLLFLARGACAGLALFGVAVMALAGGSPALVLAVWALGSIVVGVRDSWIAWRQRRAVGRRLL